MVESQLPCTHPENTTRELKSLRHQYKEKCDYLIKLNPGNVVFRYNPEQALIIINDKLPNTKIGKNTVFFRVQ